MPTLGAKISGRRIGHVTEMNIPLPTSSNKQHWSDPAAGAGFASRRPSGCDHRHSGALTLTVKRQ
jgi:hypothetical protein